MFVLNLFILSNRWKHSLIFSSVAVSGKFDTANRLDSVCFDINNTWLVEISLDILRLHLMCTYKKWKSIDEIETMEKKAYFRILYVKLIVIFLVVKGKWWRWWTLLLLLLLLASTLWRRRRTNGRAKEKEEEEGKNRTTLRYIFFSFSLFSFSLLLPVFHRFYMIKSALYASVCRSRRLYDSRWRFIVKWSWEWFWKKRNVSTHNSIYSWMHNDT